MKTIQRIIEIPLSELQTPKAKSMDITKSKCCCICGKPVSDINYSMVHLLTNGNIVSSDQDFAESQGFFPVGNDCAKKLVIKFSF